MRRRACSIAEFDKVRSPLGELVYRLKYKGDKNAISSIVEAVSWHLKAVGVAPEVIVPMPPSKRRGFQPLIEIATALAKAQAVLCSASTLTKVKSTPQLKDIGDFSARTIALEAAFAADRNLEGKDELLLDDLFQSGASMNVAAKTLKEQGLVKSVYALA